MAKKSIREMLAEEELRNLGKKRKAIEVLPQRIKALEYGYTAIRSASADGAPVSGGTNTRDDRLVKNISDRDFLQAELNEAKKTVRAVENALLQLSSRERTILDRFYINRTNDYIERLKDELAVEQSQIYRDKDMALYNFTIAFFGRR